jgi:hypothetical protein
VVAALVREELAASYKARSQRNAHRVALYALLVLLVPYLMMKVENNDAQFLSVDRGEFRRVLSDIGSSEGVNIAEEEQEGMDDKTRRAVHRRRQKKDSYVKLMSSIERRHYAAQKEATDSDGGGAGGAGQSFKQFSKSFNRIV